MNLFPSLLIYELRFSFIERIFYFDNQIYSYIFTVLCIVIFINAFNMYDGINCQSIIFTLIFFLYLILKYEINYLFVSLVIASIFFINSNYQGKLFLGNNGTILIGSLISIVSITLYNNNISLEVDTIFILMMIPGFDMLRLFYERSIKGSLPFKGDRNHIHHLLIKKYSLIITNAILSLLILVPIFVSYLNTKNNFYIIFISFFSYLYIIFFIKKKL